MFFYTNRVGAAHFPDEFCPSAAHFGNDIIKIFQRLAHYRKKRLDFLEKKIYDTNSRKARKKINGKEITMIVKNFSPMMSRTIKALLAVKPENIIRYLDIILTYPEHKTPPDMEDDPILSAILQELDRQFENYTNFDRRKEGAE